ncbi:MAG: dienelactone hydrolase family protein [Chloroflexi bacterium]|nr:dienelactone hydrolase family protein [Chloroflexota bacterium]
MCFDIDSRPPIIPMLGGALDAGPMTLTSADGTAFSAYASRAANPTGAGVLILPDRRGLHAYYEELALRFAEHGLDSVAIDYFGRTAGIGNRGADFEFGPHVGRTRWATLAADIAAGAAALRTLRMADEAASRVFVTGFCMGGRLTFLAGTLGLDLAGLIGFYGWPTGNAGNGSPAPADVAADISAPVLAIYGGADEGITKEARETFDHALDAAGVERRTVTYPGAPHSFFDRKASQYVEASAGAWAEVLAFIGGHGAGVTA